MVAARAKHTDCTQRQDQQEGASPGNVWHTCMAARSHRRHESAKAAAEANLNTDCHKNKTSRRAPAPRDVATRRSAKPSSRPLVCFSIAPDRCAILVKLARDISMNESITTL